MKNKAKILFFNTLIFIFLIIFFETSGYIVRKLLDKVSVGWVYRTDAQTLVLEEFPCVRMETHPVFSHVPDHRGDCKILGGYSNGPFVEYSRKKNDNSIVTLGGSTTSGFYQHYSKGETWPFLLNKILENQNYKYDVINGGHGGYSSSEELLQLLLNVRRLDRNIKVIISLNGINNLYSENRNYLFLNDRVVEMYERQMWIDQSFLSRFMPNINSLIRNFSPKSQFKSDMGKRKNNIINQTKKLSNVEIWESDIKIMHAISKSMGAEYLVFLQPTMGLNGEQSIMPNDLSSSDAKMLSFILDDQGGSEGYSRGYKKKLNDVYNELRAKCRIIEFCIDITDIAPPSVSNNYNNPRHHNENGNQLIANKIFDILKSKNLLKNNIKSQKY